MRFSIFVQRLKPLLLPHRKAIWWGSLLCILGSILWLIIPWALGEVITLSAALPEKAVPGDIWRYLGLVAFASLLYYAALEGARYLLYLVGEQVGLALHLQTLSATQQARFALAPALNTGQRLKQITRASASLNQFFRLYANVGLDTLISLTGIVIIFARLDPWLVLFLAAFFAGQFALGRHMTQRGSEVAEEANDEADLLMGQTFEWLRNLRSIRALGLQVPLERRMHLQRDRLVGALKRRIRLFRVRLGLLGLNQQLFRLLMLAFCIWQVVQGHFAVGVIAQVYFYFGKIEFTARQFSDLYHRMILIRIDLAAVLPLLEPVPPPVLPTLPYPTQWQTLGIQNLHFAYEDQPLFKGLQLDISRGERVGIAGLSGSGKSSLLALLLGLRTPSLGHISLDQTPLDRIAADAWVQHCAVVMQETELFELSLRDNITLGAQAPYEEARLQAAIEQAALRGRVATLPQGLDTVLRGQDYGLSGGERQRVGLARALYRQPDVLLLDEVSAHLDAASEALIQTQLERLPRDMTVVLVAHRLGMLRSMDRILVMDQGQIIEAGSFEALMAEDGAFAALWAKSMAAGELLSSGGTEEQEDADQGR